jgi:hypothetical protein
MVFGGGVQGVGRSRGAEIQSGVVTGGYAGLDDPGDPGVGRRPTGLLGTGTCDVQQRDPSGAAAERLAPAGSVDGRDGAQCFGDPARGTRLLGVVRGVLIDCHAGRSSVVCRRSDSSIGVWRHI